MASVLRTLASKSRRQLVVLAERNIALSAARAEKPVVVKGAAAPVAETVAEDVNVLIGGHKHHVNALEKRFLVWSGKYKSVDEVPATVAQETVEKARNKARIRIANYMILATIIGCFVVVISGKNAAKRGESVQQMNLDWHRQIKEDNIAANGK